METTLRMFVKENPRYSGVKHAVLLANPEQLIRLLQHLQQMPLFKFVTIDPVFLTPAFPLEMFPVDQVLEELRQPE